MYNSSLFHISRGGAGEWFFWSLLRAASALCAPLQEVFQCNQIFGTDMFEHTAHAYIKCKLLSGYCGASLLVYLPTMDKVFYTLFKSLKGMINMKWHHVYKLTA